MFVDLKRRHWTFNSGIRAWLDGLAKFSSLAMEGRTTGGRLGLLLTPVPLVGIQFLHHVTVRNPKGGHQKETTGNVVDVLV